MVGSGVAAGSAAAAVIPGDPLQIFGDGSGHLQARFLGTSVGEARPSYLDLADQRSGMVFTIYGPSGGSSFVCGPSPAGGPPTPVTAPSVTGAGSLASPYQMTTSYVCGGSLAPIAVSQKFTYVNGDTSFVASYTVTNPGTQPVIFSAVNRGVFTAAGSGQGVGLFDGTTPRTVGEFNDAQGSEGGLFEVNGSPWTRYMEGALPTGTVYEPGESGLFGELDDTVDGSLVTDPRAAVEFDRYRSSGLPPGASDTFAVGWFFGHYDGLSLTAVTAASQQVGQTRVVAAKSLNFGQPVGGGTIRYAIAGANPSAGTVTTAGDGTATISWLGVQAGQDTLTAYLDSDKNGVFDPLIDTQQVAVFSWTAPTPVPPPTPAPTPTPIPSPTPPVATKPLATTPSNAFSLIGRRPGGGGVLTLTLSGPGAGSYRAVATTGSTNSKRAYGRGSATASRSGHVTLVIHPAAAARRRITKAGLRVALAVTFTPTGGSSRTIHASVLVKA